jgi:hypothetical protein
MNGQPEPLHWDVIRCSHIATWRRSETLVANYSAFLCEVHYEDLWQTKPRIAAHYSAVAPFRQSQGATHGD